MTNSELRDFFLSMICFFYVQLYEYHCTRALAGKLAVKSLFLFAFSPIYFQILPIFPLFSVFYFPHVPSPSQMNSSIILYDIIQVNVFMNNILNFDIDRIIFNLLIGKTTLSKITGFNIKEIEILDIFTKIQKKEIWKNSQNLQF